MRRIIERISVIARIFFLSPTLFLKKAIGRILLKIVPSPKGATTIHVGGYTIVTWPSRNDWWKLMYIGYCGVEIAHNIRKFLIESGVFIDVGAGVGYFTAIASKIVGNSGEVHCFEPLPPNISAIQEMIQSKPNSNIILNSCALGVDNSVHSYFIERFDNYTMSSMVSTFNNMENISEKIEVKTKRLDKYLEQKNIREVSLIKIDVEGYEYFVLKGLEGYFKKNADRPPIIVEIAPQVCEILGYSLREFYDFMRDYGYEAYNIFNPSRKKDIRLIHETTDVIFRVVQ
ncbi:FkbM family methyltransferase [Thermodesulfobacteriota bacterium]